jgi:hypothetical protein
MLSKAFRPLTVAVAALGLLTSLSGTPAHADAMAAVVDGVGYISPQLPCPGSGCEVGMSFTLAVAGTRWTGTHSCEFYGSTGADTILSGSGSGWIGCDYAGNYYEVTGDARFYRTATTITVDGDLVFDFGGSTVYFTGTLQWVPLTLPTVEYFTVAGTVVLL